jgi:hypothetical protein
MSKWLDAAMASPNVQGLQPYAVSAISAVSSADLSADGPIGTKDANGTAEKPETQSDRVVDHWAVQAVLARFPSATIVSVKCSPDGKEREFKPAPGWWTDPPLTYAEGSAASTAALPPPSRMTRAWARRTWREDFGS